jgi:hypothetical protein
MAKSKTNSLQDAKTFQIVRGLPGAIECPFCAGMEPFIDICPSNELGLDPELHAMAAFVSCGLCGVRGPVAVTDEYNGIVTPRDVQIDAVRNWNERHRDNRPEVMDALLGRKKPAKKRAARTAETLHS